MIETVVRFLEDGNWHTLMEIKESLGIPEAELWKVIRFLQEFGFLCLDKEGKNIKLESSFLQLPV